MPAVVKSVSGPAACIIEGEVASTKNKPAHWSLLLSVNFPVICKPTGINTCIYSTYGGDRSSTVVKVLCYKTVGHWFIGLFH